MAPLAQQQYDYQLATRLQGCIPEGIIKQSMFSYAINGSELQPTLQLLYFFTASRALDMIIMDTKQRMIAAQNTYYVLRNRIKHDPNREGLENSARAAITSTIFECKKRHSSKLIRDNNKYRVYHNLDGTSALNCKNWMYSGVPIDNDHIQHKPVHSLSNSEKHIHTTKKKL